MSFDLPAIASRKEARKRGRKRSALVLPGIELTQSIIDELREIVIQPVNLWGVEARETIIPIYIEEQRLRDGVFRDQEVDRLRAAIDATDDTVQRLVVSLSLLLDRYFVRVETFHRQKWIGQVRRGTGVDIEFLIEGLGARDEVRAFQEWASGLIKGVSDDMRRRIENATFAAVTQNQPRRELANAVADAMRIGRARAKFIASDQANKLSGKFDELRHREAGIDQYRWETARDERVRPTHRANQGKIFSWNKPPRVTGHPKTEPRCRCNAQPYIELLEDVDPSALEADIQFV